MKLPDLLGEVRCTVRLGERRLCSFAVPMAWARVQRDRIVMEPRGRRRAVFDFRCGLTVRARLLVLALHVLRALRVPVEVEVCP